MTKIDTIRQAIIDDPENRIFKEQSYVPIFLADPRTRILIIGQAPGLKTQEKGAVFMDQSGDRLREWLGVSYEEFYNSGYFAVLPMDFFFPGKGKTGDLPPRKTFAAKWHPALIETMPDIKLTILIGSYACDYYLKDRAKKNLTETIKAYQEYLPKYFPMVHPSPLNRRWLAKNPYFEKDIIPVLKDKVRDILSLKEQ